MQIGLRGYWPGEKEFAWQAEHGITSFFGMHDVRDRGILAVVEQTIAIVGTSPRPSSPSTSTCSIPRSPRPGTPEPGGMTSADLLWACRELATHLDLVGMDVVEVLPTAVASARYYSSRRRADRP